MTVRAYPAYRESGVVWLGKVPTSWVTLSLKRVATITYGLGQPPEYVDTGVRFLRATNVKRGSLSTEGLVYIANPAPDITRIAHLKTGDIIVVRSGAYTGDSAIVTPDWENSIAGFDMIVRVGPDVAASFLAAVLLSPYVLEAQIALSKLRAAQPHLNAQELGEVMLVLPPLGQQAAISAFLDRETGKIDALVAEQERLIALLKEKRQAVISHAVTKGLNPNAPMKDSGVPWLGEVPAHWEVKPLKFVATVQNGVAKGRDLTNVQTIEIPYLRVANVQDGYLSLDEVSMMLIGSDEVARYLLRKGDILMNEGGDFDKLGRGQVWNAQIDPCIHQNHVFAVRPHSVDPRWITLITSAECGRFFFMSRAKQSTNLASISSTNLMELPVCCPPPTECVEILSRTEATLNALTQLSGEATRAVVLLRERRAALISAAVTGKIDVRDAITTTQAAA